MNYIIRFTDIKMGQPGKMYTCEIRAASKKEAIHQFENTHDMLVMDSKERRMKSPGALIWYVHSER